MGERRMTPAEIQSLVQRQRQFFASGKSRGIDFRISQLKKLKAAIKEMESELLSALKQDLNKSEFEGYTSEIGFVYEEINHTLKHLRTWAQPRPVATPLLHQPAASRIYPQPKGVVLVIGPWNYPMQLVLAPLVGAISAGNCVVLKPSELTAASSTAIARLVERTFSPEFCAVVGGGVSEAQSLLAERFDHIFFTGSIPVGRIVMRAAAEHLTPVTLELGGKSPCLVDKDVDIAVTCRRIAWGKFYNAGQTCVAPDYLLAPKGLKRELLQGLKAEIRAFFGERPKESPDYARIVNHRHFDRLAGLIGGDVVAGGEMERESLYIAPTILDGVRLEDKVMEEEIFGPILPVLEYEKLDDALAVIKQRPNPLACYVFTNDPATEERVIAEVPFGGGCVNNALIHLANPNLPFGGIGESGMGQYHGQDSFETFSHRKSVVRSSFLMDVKLKYPPYKGRVGLIRRLMR
jgi:aldehyde dehydrogenase (NAD+)